MAAELVRQRSGVQLAFDGAENVALLTRNEDAARMRGVVAALPFFDIGALDLTTRVFQQGKHGLAISKKLDLDADATMRDSQVFYQRALLLARYNSSYLDQQAVEKRRSPPTGDRDPLAPEIRRWFVRGGDNRMCELFRYIDLEAWVRRDHPLRAIRTIVNEALEARLWRWRKPRLFAIVLPP